MKYTNTIHINQPLEKTIALFDNEENLYQWMDGLQKIEHLSGTKGTPGAQTKMYFKMGKRDIEMIETLKVFNLPEEMTATYDAKGVYNVITTRFEKVSDTETRYVTENEFQFSGMMKVIGFLMPGAFKKQSQKYLEDFKAFAEQN